MLSHRSFCLKYTPLARCYTTRAQIPEKLTPPLKFPKVIKELHSGDALDKCKWPSFRDWSLDVCQAFRVDYKLHNKCDSSIPVSYNEEVILPPHLQAACAIEYDIPFIRKQDFSGIGERDVVKLFTRLATIYKLGGHGEGAVDMLAYDLIGLMDMGFGNHEMTMFQQPIDIRVGSVSIRGEADISVTCKSGNIMFSTFGVSPVAKRYGEQGWPQIIGCMVATCLHNLGEGVIDNFCDQETFLVNVKHSTINFCYLKLSTNTLQSLHAGEVPAEMSTVHIFPSIGLDLFNPNERLLVFKYLLLIKNYLRGSPLIGQYKK